MPQSPQQKTEGAFPKQGERKERGVRVRLQRWGQGCLTPTTRAVPACQGTEQWFFLAHPNPLLSPHLLLLLLPSSPHPHTGSPISSFGLRFPGRASGILINKPHVSSRKQSLVELYLCTLLLSPSPSQEMVPSRKPTPICLQHRQIHAQTHPPTQIPSATPHAVTPACPLGFTNTGALLPMEQENLILQPSLLFLPSGTEPGLPRPRALLRSPWRMWKKNPVSLGTSR